MLFVTEQLEDIIYRYHLIMDRYSWTPTYLDSLPIEEVIFWSDLVQEVIKQESKQKSEFYSSWAKFFVDLFKAAFGKR